MSAFFDRLEPRCHFSTSMLGTNLLVNGDFEASAGASSVGYKASPVPGWNTLDTMAVVQYGARGFPTRAQAPVNGGANFLSGLERHPIVSQPTWTARQRIMVYPLMSDIDAGRLSWDFSAALGGFGTERDAVSAQVEFYGDFDAALGITMLSGPSAAERGNRTGFRVGTATNLVPVGTRVIDVRLEAGHVDGVVADGYVDNVSLTLRPANAASKGFVGGMVFNDTRGNGMRSEGDGGLAGVTVFADLNKNKRLDTNEPRATTNAAGRYEIAGVRPGPVKVRIVSPTTLRDTTGTLQTTVAAGVVAGSSWVNFGASQTALITGNVFADNNASGKRDAAEGGFAGITVYLDANGNGELDADERSTMTDAAGNFAFVATRGKYSVRMQTTFETRQSTPARDRGYAVSLGKGGVSSKNVFGLRRI